MTSNIPPVRIYFNYTALPGLTSFPKYVKGITEFDLLTDDTPATGITQERRKCQKATGGAVSLI